MELNYYMMERYLEQSELVTTTLCLLDRSDLCLSRDENMLLQSTVNALEPFEEASKEMSAEKVRKWDVNLRETKETDARAWEWKHYHSPDH